MPGPSRFSKGTDQFKKGTGGSASGRANYAKSANTEEDESISNSKRFAEAAWRSEMDSQMGFPPLTGGIRLGWLINMQSVWMKWFDSSVVLL